MYMDQLYNHSTTISNPMFSEFNVLLRMCYFLFRYSSVSVQMFLEEVALLDPRCKTSYLSDAQGLLVSNRVISYAASLVPSAVDDPSPGSSQQQVTGN